MYSRSWVTEHLGLSPKALRNYEKYGVMTRRVEDGPRAYDEDGVKRLMTARLLQSVGFTVQEVGCILNGSGGEVLGQLQSKLEELQAERRRIETAIGYARVIRLTGSLPELPSPDRSSGFAAYLEECRRMWTAETAPLQKLNALADLAEETAATDAQLQVDSLALEAAEAVDAVLCCRQLGSSHPDTQAQAARLYELAQRMRGLMGAEAENTSPRDFARVMIRMYTGSGIGEIQRRTLGEENCRFIAEALAAFGGYERPEDAE